METNLGELNEKKIEKLSEIKIEKAGRQNTIKGLMVVLICLLTVYAPIELTRVIIAWGLTTQFIFELAFVWLFYALAIFMISATLRTPGREKSNQQENSND